MSPLLQAALLFVHLLAAVVWVGGMVFAHFALRPAAIEVLEPPARLRLLAATLGRFFRLVAVAVVALIASGLALLGQAELARAPLGWHLMLAGGLVMAGVYGFIHGVLFPRLRQTVAQSLWPAAAAALERIRRLVFFNLCLGVATLAAAASARAG